MSWKGFSKAISRLPHQAKAKTGRVEVSTDTTYHELQGRFNELAYYLLKIQKEIMVFKDAIRDTIHAHCDFIHRLADVYHNPDLPGGSPLVDYLTDAEETRDHIQIQLDTIDTSILAPLIELGNVLRIAEKTMAKRSRKKLDYDRYMGGEKGASLATATHDYEHLNTKLKQELPLLFSYVDQIMRSLFVRLHGLQCTIYELLMDHTSSQGALLPEINRNITDDYHERVAHIPEMIESLDLFQLYPRERSNTAPIPPPKFLDEIDPIPSLHDRTDNGIGLGIIPNTYEHQAPSSSKTKQQVHCYGVAMSDYEAQGIGDLSFRKNQPIEVLEAEDNEDGWWTARIGREIGFVPSNHIKLLQQENVNV